jgi:hypothetical protein
MVEDHRLLSSASALMPSLDEAQQEQQVWLSWLQVSFIILSSE